MTTPGPWTYRSFPEATIIAGDTPSLEATGHMKHVVRREWSDDKSRRNIQFIADILTKDEADGHLIAAAPDLYAALTALRDAVKANPAMQGRQYVDLGIQVHNALDKAEGRR